MTRGNGGDSGCGERALPALRHASAKENVPRGEGEHPIAAELRFDAAEQEGKKAFQINQGASVSAPRVARKDVRNTHAIREEKRERGCEELRIAELIERGCVTSIDIILTAKAPDARAFVRIYGGLRVLAEGCARFQEGRGKIPVQIRSWLPCSSRGSVPTLPLGMHPRGVHTGAPNA